MKKILIMNNSLNGGGAEKVLQTLLSHIDYKEYDITLYSVLKDCTKGYNNKSNKNIYLINLLIRKK